MKKRFGTPKSVIDNVLVRPSTRNVCCYIVIGKMNIKGLLQRASRNRFIIVGRRLSRTFIFLISIVIIVPT